MTTRWDQFIGRYIPVITTLVAVFGVLIGVHQFNVTREKEFKKYFWEQQLNFYVQASRDAAQLATMKAGGDRDKVLEDFNGLYHGQMVIFEDESVMKAMKHFAEIYIDYQANPGIQTDVQRAARDLARSCRESSAETWSVPLEKLTFDVEDSKPNTGH
jgi:hypothetical protein